MNKLLFYYERNFNDDIILIANNHKDLEEYLKSTYKMHNIVINDLTVCIMEEYGFEKEYVELKWVKQI